MDPAFPEWSKKVVLFCHITSRVSSDPHPNLLQEKGGRGFPYLACMDAEGGVIAKHQGERTVAGFGKTLESAQSFLDLRRKADAGDKTAVYDVLLFRLGMGSVAEPDVKKALGQDGELDKEQEARLQPLLVLNEYRAIQAAVTRNDPKSGQEAGRRYLEMKKAGRIPALTDETQHFWICMMDHAEAQKDAVLYQEALAVMKEKYGANPRSQKFFADHEAG